MQARLGLAVLTISYSRLKLRRLLVRERVSGGVAAGLSTHARVLELPAELISRLVAKCREPLRRAVLPDIATCIA